MLTKAVGDTAAAIEVEASGRVNTVACVVFTREVGSNAGELKGEREGRLTDRGRDGGGLGGDNGGGVSAVKRSSASLGMKLKDLL